MVCVVEEWRAIVAPCTRHVGWLAITTFSDADQIFRMLNFNQDVVASHTGSARAGKTGKGSDLGCVALCVRVTRPSSLTSVQVRGVVRLLEGPGVRPFLWGHHFPPVVCEGSAHKRWVLASLPQLVALPQRWWHAQA